MAYHEYERDDDLDLVGPLGVSDDEAGEEEDEDKAEEVSPEQEEGYE